jgi:hypothetical protein
MDSETLTEANKGSIFRLGSQESILRFTYYKYVIFVIRNITYLRIVSLHIRDLSTLSISEMTPWSHTWNTHTSDHEETLFSAIFIFIQNIYEASFYIIVLFHFQRRIIINFSTEKYATSIYKVKSIRDNKYTKWNRSMLIRFTRFTS